jgi:hypothetical protein
VSQPSQQVIEATGFTNLDAKPGNTTTYRFAQNLFAVRTQGIEAEVTTRAQLADNMHINGSVGYTYVNLNTEGDVQSQYLSNVARHLVAGNVSLTHRRFTLAVGGLYKVRAGQNTTVTPTNGQLVAHAELRRLQRPPRPGSAARARVAGGPGPKPVQRPVLGPAGGPDAHPLAHGRRARGAAEVIGGVCQCERNAVERGNLSWSSSEWGLLTPA